MARQTAEQRAAQEQQRAQAEQLFSRVLEEAKLPMLEERPADQPDAAAWNSAVQARRKQAQALLFGNEQPEALVRAALSAVSFQPLVEHTQSLAAENEQLRQELANLRKAQPTVQRATAPPAHPGQPNGAPAAPVQRGSRPMAVAAEWMAGLNQPQE
jgi:hypothetical protein